MLVLYRANPEAFMGNINALKAGAILRIPPADSTNVLSATEAGAEVRQQNSAWGSGARPAGEAPAKLQLVAPSAGEGDSAGQASSPSGSSASGAEAQAADASANAGQSQARIKVLEQQLDESKRLLSLRDSEMQSLQQRIAELEKSGAVDAGPAATDTGTSDVAAEIPVTDEPLAEAPMATEEPLADQPVAEEPVAQVPATEEPSADVSSPEDAAAVDDGGASESGSLLSNMWLWAAVAGVLLLTVFVIRQRKTVAAGGTSDRWSTQRKEIDHADTLKDFSDLPSNQDSIIVEVSPFAKTDVPAEDAGVDIFDDPADKFPQAGGSAFATDKFSFGDVGAVSPDFGGQDAAGQDEVELPLEKTISTGAPLNLDQADPVAEAEFHMAYGLYDQAADLLTRALKDDADNRAYRLKLLEVFFVWENKDGFLEQARILQAGGVSRSDSDWNKVLILGKQLCPADPLFSGVASSPAAGSMDLELSDAGETSVDFSVDSGGADLNFDAPTGSELDLDLSSGFGGSVSGDESARNFGNRPTDSSGVATIALDPSMLDFDMGESDDAATMESPTLDVMGAGSPTVAVDFDLDGGETIESPTLAGPANEATLESPTLDALGLGAETSEMPFLSKSSSFDSDPLMDPTGLDIDLSGLADLPLDSDDFAAMESGTADSSAPVFGDDKKRLSPETENIYVSSDDATIFASLEQLGKVAGDTHEPPPSPLVSDTLQQPQFNDEANDTAEQPGISGPVELGGDFDDFVLSDEPKFADDATMTEVGTKLDLARAYIDMGDPDGARSILEEVLDEGGEAQQQQARQLLNELND
jgi:pilus assembly protein FimV